MPEIRRQQITTPVGRPTSHGNNDGVEDERRRKGLAWAAKHLPDQHAPFVYIAAQMLRREGKPITAETVRARLEQTGRLQ